MDFGVGGREAAERWLGVAERLLGARDLVGSKRFAERAMECNPLLDGVDQVLAVADVLLASQRRVNNHVNWYAVLDLPPPSGDRRASDDPNTVAAVRRQYRRLSLLLDPDRNRFPGAESAFVLVADAYSVLSDPLKRSLFEDELRAASSANATPVPALGAEMFPDPAPKDVRHDVFWTVCTSCCHVHQYDIEYIDRSLRCTSCNRAFVATELPAPPPIVPGTDMYYCAWGFFPLGFSGGDLDRSWKPFYPMFPSNGKEPANAPAGGQQSAQNQTQTSSTAGKKRVATKKVGRPRKKPLNNGNNEKTAGTATPRDAMQGSGSRPINLDGRGVTGININLGFDGSIGCAQGVDHPEPVNFHIDLDATDEIMGNLQNLPFLKDDGIPFRML